IEALGKDDAAVIEVTRLFTTDVPEFSGRTRVGARAFDATRSFVERAVSFPENVEVEATHTYNNPPQEGAAGGRGGPGPAPPAPGGRGATPPRVGTHSVLMHFSMVLLPEKPMQARLFDERVGYFSTSVLDYGKDEHRAPQRRARASEKEESEGGGARAGQTDRLLDRSSHPDQVGAIPEKGSRELAAGVRSGRVQERHHREGGAEA